MPIFICKKCNKEFKGRFKDGKPQKYCSHECQWEDKKGEIKPEQWEKRVCKKCGMIFEVRKSNTNKYCSPECYISTFAMQSDIKNGKCIYCGKDFIRITPKQKYCSQMCGIKHKSEKVKTINICATCGKEFFTAPTRTRMYCNSKCNPARRERNHDMFKEEVKTLTNNEYELISEYSNAKTKVYIKHKKCGHEWKVTPDSFLQGTRCPKCNESHGEKQVEYYLIKNHIQFKGQYKIKECKNIRPLPFDFAIFKNNNLLCLIEYDGLQHYRENSIFGGKDNLKEINKRDKIKNEYCKSHNIPLVRIPYTIKNIEKYLENELSKLL